MPIGDLHFYSEDPGLTFEEMAGMQPHERMALMWKLTNEARARQRAEARLQYPDVSERELELLCAEANYGREVIDKVRQDLIRRGEIEK